MKLSQLIERVGFAPIENEFVIEVHYKVMSNRTDKTTAAGLIGSQDGMK